jgi:SAM-dependent methyltransferase
MTFHFPDPVFANESDYAAMRDLFRAAHFTRKDIPIALGIPSVESFRQFPRPTMAAMTSGGRPIDALVRLFLMHEPVPVAVLTKALAPMSVASWVEAGILMIEGENAFPNMGLAIYDDLWLLHDTKMEVGNEYVMGVAGTTASLANQAIFSPGNLALDLGTGCGVIAFLAAKHCTRVLATDKNPRAIAVARFNAKLNGLSNVDFAIGDLYEPVKPYLAALGSGAAFDFIYCNPPFVITPSPQFMYRDSGLVGDAIVEAVARGAGPLLSDGGVAQFVCNWMHVGDQPWQQRLTSWVAESGCDALIFQSRTISPLDYASIWIEETEKAATPEARWKMLNEWMKAYEALGLKGVSFGLFTLRRTSRRQAWVAFEDVPEHLVSAAGPHIAEMLASRDYLASLGTGPSADAALADANLCFSQHLRVDQHLRPGAGAPGAAQDSTPSIAWKHERDDIRLAHGYGFARAIDQRHMDVLMALDGSHTVRQIVERIAATTKAPAAALLPVVVRLCRGWLEKAFVLPPGFPRGG